MKYLKKLNFLVVVAFSLIVVQASAQNTIRGVVTSDENGVAFELPGVTIAIKGTSKGAITDIDGSYSLEASPEDILVFSYLGYQTVEVTVGTQTTINIELEEDLELLEEVVVVGYGTLKKSEITGSISSIGGDELAALKLPSFDQALQGSVAGVQVNTAGGVPGGPIKIQVRGTNSVSANTNPLFIIDGIPIAAVSGQADFNPMASINPDDIASVEVLKDASATAIYGSRGANGVIIVTTKTGGSGGSSTSVSYTSGVSQAFNLPTFASTREWWDMYDDALDAAGNNPIADDAIAVGVGSFTGSFSPFSQVLTRDQVQDIDVNWTDQALRSGMFHEFNASHSGSGEKTNYFFSLNYRDEEAVYVGSKFQRIATRANINANISDYLTGGIRLNNTVTLNDQPLLGDGFRRAMRSNLTWWPLLNSETGELNDRQGRYNIDYLLDDNYNFRRRETLRSMSSTFLELKLPFYEKVSIRSEAGLDVRHNISNSFTSFFINPEGSEANQSTLTNYSLNYNVYATFKEQLGDHSFNVVLGIERNDFEQKSSSVTGTGLDQRRDINEPGDVSIANLKQDFAGTTGSTRFDGRFGRVNYSFKDRYLFNASFRRDASSIFPEENQAGWFRAFSVGHITSDEEFWPTNFVVNFFKIRASYGEVGNHRFPNNLGQTQYVVWPRYGDRQGQSLTSIGNESLQWEDINTTEFGLEFGLLQNRISGGFSYYLMDTENAILPTPVPASYGAAPYSATNTQFANVGTLSNEGFEFELRSVNINKGGFSWNTTLNLTLNRSIVKKIALIEGVTELQVSGGRVLLREEENLGAYFLPAYAGIDEDGNELIYRVDEEGNLTDETVILATGAVAQENRVFTADRTTQPTYWGGLTNTFSYKNFTLSAFFSFQGGNYLLDTWERDVSYIGSGRNVILAEVAENRWESSFSPPTSLPAADLRSTNGLLSDRFLQKGDFIRLRSLRIGYNLPDAVLDKLKLSRAEIYILGNNLFTITDFKGLDPEALRIQSGGFVDDAIDYNLGQGIITSGSIAPQVRMFSAGISFGF